MTAPLFSQLFSCEECGVAVESRRRWCSSKCKLRAWTRLHPDRKYTRSCICATCQQGFEGIKGTRYCSPTCKAKAKKPKQVVTRVCVECSHAFTVHIKTSQQKTCSPKCRAARLSKVLRGKKYRATKTGLACAECGKEFATSRKAKRICNRCAHKNTGHHERRAHHKGAPYIYGIKPERVFERDHWRCQLCGCKTPRRLRGKNQPTSPEIDHIIPISQGGGHTWDNVQCACRKCNMKKGAVIRGQLRLAI